VAELDQREVFTDHMLWAKVRDILKRIVWVEGVAF
jgi:hypothetical protein